MNELRILKADYGDSIIIRFLGNDNNFHNILVDGGLVRTYKKTKILKKEVSLIYERNEKIDLLIVTHIDQDHIGGIKSLFSDEAIDKPKISKIWFNSGKLISSFFNTTYDETRNIPLYSSSTETEISVSQGIFLENKIENNVDLETEIIFSLKELKLFGATLTVLSPSIESLAKLNKKWQVEVGENSFDMSSIQADYIFSVEELRKRNFKTDKSIPNNSSIAFIFRLKGKTILLLGDAPSQPIIKSLNKLGYSDNNKLKVDFWKISHHGGKSSTSPDLINIIECTNFIISTNGSKYRHPSKETLARLISPSCKSRFYFNYDNSHLRNIFTAAELDQFNIECNYSKHPTGHIINF